MTLGGKCALVTGSTQGLGLAAARALALAGCNVILHGPAPSADADQIRAGLESQCGVRTLFCDADLRRPDDIAQMMADAGTAFGSVDILVNNAVVRHSAPVEAFPTDKWDEGLAVNLSSAFHTIRLAVPGMRRKGWGRIINVSSVYGLTGAPQRVGYVTTKTALIGLTRAVALELVGQDITCNAVCPGTTLTPTHEATLQGLVATGLSRAEAEARFLAGKQPTGRIIAADDVAALIVFLCRPECRDITGTALPVDGGWSAS